MKTFAEFEDAYQRKPVRLLDYDEATGVLYLKGQDTLLQATSKKLLHPGPVDENGWFDLRLLAPDGRTVLLHNALTLSTSSHGSGDRKRDAYGAEIFPNLIVDDADALAAGHRVRRVTFRLSGLENFFYYQHAEPLIGFSGKPEEIDALRAMRFEQPGKDHLFAPNRVYVMHDYPPYFSFKVCDRQYEVWAGGRESMGSVHRIRAEAYPVGSITFDDPVDLDAALDRFWEWRTFFSEMAVLPLAVESMSVTGSADDGAPTADIYLPNLPNYSDFTRGHYSLSPAHLPLNGWAERQALADGMRQWLTLGDERRTFRGKLYRVIESMNRRCDPNDLIELASAIESLTELSGKEAIPRAALDAMTDAAHAAAVAAEVTVERKRIRGVLGNLQRPSLATRYEAMGNRAAPPLPKSDAELLARSATQIRHALAHGGALDDQVHPRVSPTIQALAALAARFDLESCGIPSQAGAGGRAMAKRRFDDGIHQLQLIEREARGAS